MYYMTMYISDSVRGKRVLFTVVSTGIGEQLAYLYTQLAMYYMRMYISDSVRGKRVLITGASTGIGEQLAYHYAQLGANVVITARRERRLQEVRPFLLSVNHNNVF